MRGAERPLAGDTPYDFRERMRERIAVTTGMVTDARKILLRGCANVDEDDDPWISPHRSSRFDAVESAPAGKGKEKTNGSQENRMIVTTQYRDGTTGGVAADRRGDRQDRVSVAKADIADWKKRA